LFKNDITRAAKEAGLASNIKDFKLVNEQSIGIETELRDKIVAIKTFPSNSTI
jgi:N-acetyl-anhydromuramyl-L-alanine amidase AmpD